MFSGRISIFFIAFLVIGWGCFLPLYSQYVEVVAYLRNGSVIIGKNTTLKNVSVKTDYGTLIIPLSEVFSIEPGIFSSVNVDKEVQKNIGLYLTGNESAKASVKQRIMEIGIEAIPPLDKYLNSNSDMDQEVMADLYELLNALRATHSYSRDTYQDIVSYGFDSRVAGEISWDRIDITTAYGKMVIPPNDIAELHLSYIEEGNISNRHYILNAATHITANNKGGWLNTGIRLTPGMTIKITANGQITLASLSNAVYTPLGPLNNSINGTDYQYQEESTGIAIAPQYGNIVYKIGEFGQLNSVPINQPVSVSEAGILYLSIYETIYDPNNKGSYKIKVEVK